MIDSIGMIIIIVMIPFTYNIVNGISLGFISYTVLKVLTGKYKDVSPSMYVLTVLFVLSFIMNISMGIMH